jgi:hypothetical protein
MLWRERLIAEACVRNIAQTTGDPRGESHDLGVMVGWKPRLFNKLAGDRSAFEY